MAREPYPYVGPEEIRSRSATTPGGRRIDAPADLRDWLSIQRANGNSGPLFAATFVIDSEGQLRLADRHSEHVACAAGGPVLSAGEMFFSISDEIAVEEVSNLSTGFCPEPESWWAVRDALDRLGLPH